MEAKGQKKPLFMKTYSRNKPAWRIPKPALSQIIPADRPSSSGSTRKWIDIPTGSPSVSEISKDSTDLDTLSENSSEQELSFVPKTIKNVERNFGKQTSTPLVSIGNILASRHQRHSLRRTASPCKQNKKPMPKFARMALIEESDTDSTNTDDELIHRSQQIRQRRNSSSAKENGSKIIAPHSRQSKRVRTPSLMVRGMGYDVLGMPLASSTALSNKLSPMSSQDMYSADESDSEEEDVSTSEEDSTLVEQQEDDDEEEESVEDIEIMRDLPDPHVLSVQGKKMPMVSKSKLTPSKKRLDSIKSQLESLSLNNSSQGSRKQVSFVLKSQCNEAEEPESHTRTESIQLPHLPVKAGILKKTNHDSRSDVSSTSFSSTLVACDDRNNRMISTPKKVKAKNDKMIQLSFDVSAVPLPSYDVSDLVVQSDATQQSKLGVKQSNVPGTKKIIQKTQSSLNGKPLLYVQPQQADVIAEDLGFSDSEPNDEPMPQPDWTPRSQLKRSSPESTPRSQLKRSSPESHLPFRPSKRKLLMKGPAYVTTSVEPLHKSPSSNRLQKRLEYQEPSSDLPEIPECCITLIKKSTCRSNGVQIKRYVSPKKIPYKKIQQIEQDILEVYFG